MENKAQKIICCWGDSITEGAFMKPGETYPDYLQEFLGEEYFVLNGGSGGERTETIMARQGAHKVFLDKDISFDKGSDEVIMGTVSDNHLVTENGEHLKLTKYLGNQLSINPVVINGQFYELKYDAWSWENSSGILKIMRRSNKESFILKSGSEVFFDSLKYKNKAFFNVFFMGTNRGSYKDEDDLFEQHKLFAQRIGSENYILIIPPFYPNEDMRYIKEFGEDRAFSLRAYLSSEDILKKENILISKEDIKYIKERKIPPCFTYLPNDPHLNSLGYKLMAQEIAKRINKICK